MECSLLILNQYARPPEHLPPKIRILSDKLYQRHILRENKLPLIDTKIPGLPYREPSNNPGIMDMDIFKQYASHLALLLLHTYIGSSVFFHQRWTPRTWSYHGIISCLIAKLESPSKFWIQIKWVFWGRVKKNSPLLRNCSTLLGDWGVTAP